MEFFDKIYKSKFLYALIGTSILLFLIKGIKYLIIGSYVPIVFIIAVVMLVYFSFKLKPKSHRRILRFWAILIIFWALARLIFWLILQIDTNLTESHIREQFGLFQHIISIVMLGIGIGIIKELKSRKPAGNTVYN